MPTDKRTFLVQAVERMTALIDVADTEEGHWQADQILVDALSADPDFTELLAVYELVPKWYA